MRLIYSCNKRFKIDLIVWKLFIVAYFLTCSVKFKIDLIVWKFKTVYDSNECRYGLK